eukprot:2817477-Ditylum_brightwellii.AAC.2
MPKGKSDIRIAWDATNSMLNAVLWAPNVGLPTVDTVARSLNLHVWSGDLAYGEMFHNYMLHPDLIPYAGVNISTLLYSESDATCFHQWEQLVTGLRSSSYLSTKASLWRGKLVRGNCLCPKTPLQWDIVVLNMPGNIDYQLMVSKVYKLNNMSGQVANNFVTYFDNARAMGNLEAACYSVL